jgi:sugar phosphate isomerase/epimerase
MMRGPAIFLAQFAGDAAPFDSLRGIAGWAAALGYKGVQIPSWDARLFDLDRAADSDEYCDDVKSTLAKPGIALTGKNLRKILQGETGSRTGLNQRKNQNNTSFGIR